MHLQKAGSISFLHVVSTVGSGFGSADEFCTILTIVENLLIRLLTHSAAHVSQSIVQPIGSTYREFALATRGESCCTSARKLRGQPSVSEQVTHG